jgi:uncharacterized delta-60 repeat protein
MPMSPRAWTGIVLIAFAALAPAADAAPGDLDPSFGEFGVLTLPFADTGDRGSVWDVDRTPDGDAIVTVNRKETVGPPRFESSSPLVARITPSGALEPSFAAGGISAPFGTDRDVSFYSLVPDQAGRMLIAATVDGQPAVVRLLADGSLDASFGSGGIAELGADRDILATRPTTAQGADGTVVAAVPARYEAPTAPTAIAVHRLLPDGSPDTSFGEGGVATVDVGSDPSVVGAAVADDGGIVVVGGGRSGSFPAITAFRLRHSGALDDSFGDHGVTRAPASLGESHANAATVAADGSIIVAGDLLRGVGGLVRFSPSGAADKSFGGDGIAEVPLELSEALGVTTAPHGRLVAVGTVTFGDTADALVSRFTSRGRADRAFGTGGLARVELSPNYDYLRGVVVDARGRVLAAGAMVEPGLRGPTSSRAVVLRLRNGGRRDRDADGFADGRDRCRTLPARHHRGCPFVRTRVHLDRKGSRRLVGVVRSHSRRCWNDRAVALVARRPGRDRVVARTRASTGRLIEASFSFKTSDKGRLYARVRPIRVARIGICGGARSNAVPATG